MNEEYSNIDGGNRKSTGRTKMRFQINGRQTLYVCDWILTWIICNKPNGHNAIFRNSYCVLQDRTNQVSLEQHASLVHVLDDFKGGGFLQFRVAHDIEAVAVKVEYVLLFVTT